MKFILAALSLLATGALAAPQPAEFNKIKRSTTGRVKADSYIVVLKDSASRQASIQSLDELIIAFDDVESVKEVTYSDWTVLNGYAARLTGAALKHVLADPNVDYVEEDAILSIDFEAEARAAAAQPVQPAQLVHLDKRAAGSGTNFYGIDTGILTTHTSFGSRATWLGAYGGYAQRDGNGHGTHTAGSAAGNGFGPANQALIYSVKVLSDAGSGAISDIVAGVNAAVNHAVSSGRPSVANLSLGGGAATALDSAVSNGISRGVHFTIAAGNSNVNAANTSPARVAAAVTVGAISSNNAKASFSNFGAVLDVHFLGVSVTSAWIGSNSATNSISGTSMAAPGVAGILLSALSTYGSKTPAALIADLKANAQAAVTGVPSGTTNLKARAW